MKTIMSVLCMFVLLSGMATPLPKNKQLNVSSAAFNDEFTRFNGHRQQNGIMLTWTFTSPNNAVSFVIERSYDGTYFETAAEIAPGAGRNQYKDNAVYPGYTHYRIKALMYDGSVIYSHTEVVRIVRNG